MTLLSDHIQLICKWVRPSGSASKFRFKANQKLEEGGSIKCYWVLGIVPRGQRVWSRSACAPSLCCLLPWLWYRPYLSLSVVSLKTGVMIFQAQWCHGAWPRLDRGLTAARLIVSDLLYFLVQTLTADQRLSWVKRAREAYRAAGSSEDFDKLESTSPIGTQESSNHLASKVP